MLVNVLGGCTFVALLLRTCLADQSILEGLATPAFWRTVPAVGSVMLVHGIMLLPTIVWLLLTGEHSPFSGQDKLAASVSGLAGFFFLLWIVARFCFAYTFSAFNRGFGLRQSWRASAKTQWQLWSFTVLLAVLPGAFVSLTDDAQLEYQLLADVSPYWAWIMNIWGSAEFVFVRALHVLMIAGASVAIFGEFFSTTRAKAARAEAVARTFD